LIVFTTTGPSYYKGLETACQALWELQNIGVDVEWRFAGINENDLIVTIVKKYLGKKYPKKGITYLGKLTERELVSELLNSDVYVMPSHIENSPNSLYEAQIVGIPCIVTHAGGVKSILNDGNILIQDGDPWAMAGSIASLNIKNKTVLNINKTNDKDIVINSILNTYVDIIK